jgi:hypothetical protein
MGARAVVSPIPEHVGCSEDRSLGKAVAQIRAVAWGGEASLMQSLDHDACDRQTGAQGKLARQTVGFGVVDVEELRTIGCRALTERRAEL